MMKVQQKTFNLGINGGICFYFSVILADIGILVWLCVCVLIGFHSRL